MKTYRFLRRRPFAIAGACGAVAVCAAVGLLAITAGRTCACGEPSKDLSVAVPITECDRLTASPYDPEAVAPGVALNRIDHVRAIPACEAAVVLHPGVLRFSAQLALAHAADKQVADAVRLFRQAAEKGYGFAMIALGEAYERGAGGLPEDEAEAVRWLRQGAEALRQAAENGNTRAMYTLGVLQAGTDARPRLFPKDDAVAVRWLQQAADKGHPLAMYELGRRYHSGWGVAKDADEAARLLFSVIEQGNQHRSTIIADRAPKYVISSRRSAEFRRAFQRRLTDAGLYSGPIDGEFGPAVMRALEILQQRAPSLR